MKEEVLAATLLLPEAPLYVVVALIVDALPTGAVVGMIAHGLVLVLLLNVVTIWYWAVAIYKETPAGMPANPADSP